LTVSLTLTLVVLFLAGWAAWGATKLLRRWKTLRARNWPASQDYPVRTDWRSSSGRRKYSSFVYFDVDRDGVYGLTDRPMGGIVVRLRAGDRHKATARTNVNGFANFSAAIKRKAYINRPGEYEFAVSVPPGWIATSKNDVQSRRFKAVPGSPAGLDAEEMVRPVGIAPERFVRGVLPAGLAASAVIRAGDKEVAAHEVSGAFLVKVPEGADGMTLRGEGLDRPIPLGAYPVELGRFDARRVRPATGKQPMTIGFDDATTRALLKVPCGYAGLNWFNLNIIRRDFEGNYQGYVNCNTSSEHSVYTSSGHPAEFWSDAPFDFVGAMLSVAWLNGEGETGIIECFRGETLALRDEVKLSALTPVHYLPMIADVTRVRLSTLHYWQMIMDDLTIAR
jgi:hypothetical protein